MLRWLLYFILTVASVIQLVTTDNDDPCKTAEAENGTCIQLPDCDIIYEYIKLITRPISVMSTEYLKRSHCGFSGNIPKVCCPNKQDRGAHFMELSNHNKSYLLERNVCGVSQRSRIINGIEAGINEFSWIALLIYDTVKNPYQCAGSIITERYILTAGHCITSDLKKVRLGEYTLSTERDCQNFLGKNFCGPPVKEYGIEETILHELYYFPQYLADIALIRLDESIDFTDGNLMPVCLPLYGNLRRLDLNSKNLTVVGWGLTEQKKLSDVLLKVSVKVVNNEECTKSFRLNHLSVYLNNNKLCAGTKGQNTCRGDSGGPVMYIGVYDNRLRYVQYGIISYGHVYCDTDLPDVHTRVTEYMEWILDNLEP